MQLTRIRHYFKVKEQNINNGYCKEEMEKWLSDEILVDLVYIWHSNLVIL